MAGRSLAAPTTRETLAHPVYGFMGWPMADSVKRGPNACDANLFLGNPNRRLDTRPVWPWGIRQHRVQLCRYPDFARRLAGHRRLYVVRMAVAGLARKQSRSIP